MPPATEVTLRSFFSGTREVGGGWCGGGGRGWAEDRVVVMVVGRG